MSTSTLLIFISVFIAIISLVFSVILYNQNKKLSTRTPSEITQKNIEKLTSKYVKIEKRLQDTFITSIELTNIRCFEKFKLDFRSTDKKAPAIWTMILGDNAAGKTTLLRSIALGLCSEGDAVSLMKEVPGDFVRKGEREGEIRVNLLNMDLGEEFTITTKIIKSSRDGSETVRQNEEKSAEKLRDNIFVCGYGSQRSSSAISSSEAYTPRESLRMLFNYESHLQNPEVILLRQPLHIRNQIEQKLIDILMLEPLDNEISYTPSGLEIAGPWGNISLESLSEGYRSTFHWILDFLSWSIYAGSFSSHQGIGGIILIDELEQHLHPKWQRYIVQKLQSQFPETQFIATTHTPLVAAGVSDIQDSILFRLEMDESGHIISGQIDKEELKGKRADQILASDAFGLVTSRSPKSINKIDRYTELYIKKRNEVEEIEFNRLSDELDRDLVIGESRVKQIVEKALSKTLDQLLQSAPKRIIDLESKRKINELFKTDDSK